MGMTAIFAMFLFPLTLEGSTLNLALTDLVVSEEKMFESVDGQTTKITMKMMANRGFVYHLPQVS